MWHAGFQEVEYQRKHQVDAMTKLVAFPPIVTSDIRQWPRNKPKCRSSVLLSITRCLAFKWRLGVPRGQYRPWFRTFPERSSRLQLRVSQCGPVSWSRGSSAAGVNSWVTLSRLFRPAALPFRLTEPPLHKPTWQRAAAHPTRGKRTNALAAWVYDFGFHGCGCVRRWDHVPEHVGASGQMYTHPFSIFWPPR